MLNTYGIQFKSDTAANWTSNNPTLLEGELGYENDTGKFKIGDGSTDWSSLSYFQTTAGSSDGLGLTWNFDTTTKATPSSGDIRFNNATPASVTQIFIHETGAVAAYGHEMMVGLVEGDGLFIQAVGDTAKYLYGTVGSTITDNGSDWTFDFNVIGSGTLPANNDVVSVIPVYTSTSGRISNLVEDTTPQLGGDLDMNGNNIEGVTPAEIGYVSGVTSAIQTQLDGKPDKDDVGLIVYEFDTTTTAAGISSGQIRFNNATPTSVSEIYIHKNASNGGAFLGTPEEDVFYLQVIGDKSKYFLIDDWNGITDNTTYWTFYLSGTPTAGSLPSNGDFISVIEIHRGKISRLLDDTSPQLGGSLNAATYNITNIGNIEVEGHSYADGEVDDGNSSTADTIDWTTGNFHKSTMTGNCTYTFTAPTGPTTLILKLVQDGTGSRTATFPASVKWPSGTAPTLSTAASSIDIITFYYDGTNYFGTSVLNLS